ncbi:hypothetical protein BHM03_00023666 [Ensete ventricosum]|nr:hypothetical protein BHM03_00023666 [Ensete ventricosum]
MDAKALRALEVMKSCHDFDSVMIEGSLALSGHATVSQRSMPCMLRCLANVFITRACLVDGPRSSLGIGSGLDDAVEPRREFARRFAEGIGKLARNTPGDHRKKTIGQNAKGYRIRRE